MSIQAHIAELQEIIPTGVTMVAVSKFHPSSMIQEAYDCGQRVFGESRVQELLVKQQELPNDIQWHFIGTLQRNKVKQIAPFISLIHSLDSERLMLEIEKQGAACSRVIPCLLQLHVAQEETKSGFTPDECRAFLENGRWRECNHIQFSGIMGMATYTNDDAQIRKEFQHLKSLFEEFKAKYFADIAAFKEISMGMSGDFSLAIEEGSTMIRLGTVIFGER